MAKKNEYIVVRRFHKTSSFHNPYHGVGHGIPSGFNWDEFEDTVRRFTNSGAACVGGICITEIGGTTIVAQSLQYRRTNGIHTCWL